MERTSWGLVLLLFLAGLLAAMQFAKLSLTLGDAAAIWPGRPVAFLVSAVSVVGVALGAVAGSAVARFGARPAILWAVAGSGAVSILQAALPPFGAMLALRALEGAGHLALVVALPTLMAASASPSMRPVVMGLWGTFFGVGFALGALALGALAPWGPRAPYLAHGAACLLLLPALWRMVPSLGLRGAAVPGLLDVHRAIYGRARLAAPGVAHGIYTSLFIALVAFLPAALGALWLTALLPLANLAGTFAAGVAARRVAPGRIVVTSFAAAAAGFASLAVAPAMAGAAPLALLTIFATGTLAGANFAAVPALNPRSEDQARANGGMAQLGNVGTFLGTPALGLAFALGGAPALLGAAAAVSLLGAVAGRAIYGRAGREPAAAG